MSLLHSSTRRPPALQDVDYDHEIRLVDHTRPDSPQPSRSPSANGSGLTPVISNSSSRRDSNVPLKKHHTSNRLRTEITRRKYAKYQDQGNGEGVGRANENGNEEVLDDGIYDEGANEDSHEGQDTQEEDGSEGRGRHSGPRCPKGPKGHKEPRTEIDVLYENQRGGFLCGMALFSRQALGNLDPSPWTNIAHKTSPTDITNAQVPDPSWEWLWPEWRVNHEDGVKVDDDGWEYSFAFSRRFSWHGPRWWSSFVRRRAWIRKRVKKHIGYAKNAAHMLNPDYFTIHSVPERSRSRASSIPTSDQHRLSFYSRHEAEADMAPEDISDIGALMKALRLTRIDREKTEAIESFIEHGGDDLFYMGENMHEIMGMFIFQASRRSLLTHLLKVCNEAAEKKKQADEDHEREDKGEDKKEPPAKGRYEYLEAAVQHADEEVKKLEYWSDVKEMAEKGETKGAVDESQGWDSRWTGLDGSGPRDVWEHTPAGTDDCDEHEGNGMANLAGKANGKGKGKA